jgi:hypothetical protein
VLLSVLSAITISMFGSHRPQPLARSATNVQPQRQPRIATRDRNVPVGSVNVVILPQRNMGLTSWFDCGYHNSLSFFPRPQI